MKNGTMYPERPPDNRGPITVDDVTPERINGPRADQLVDRLRGSRTFQTVVDGLEDDGMTVDESASVSRLRSRRGERLGHRLHVGTTPVRAGPLVATFDGGREPVVSVAVVDEDGDGKTVYRADAGTLDAAGPDLQTHQVAAADSPEVDVVVEMDDDTRPRVGGTVTLTAENSAAYGDDPTLAIYQYEWDLDDDGTFEYAPDPGGALRGATVEVPHDSGGFTEAGEHTVNVRVTTTTGETAVGTFTFEVLPEDTPVANISIPSQSEIEELLEYLENVPDSELLPDSYTQAGLHWFSAAETEHADSVTEFRWDFAPDADASGKRHGSAQDSQLVAESVGPYPYMYEVEGDYTVTLEAVGETYTSVDTRQITVEDTGLAQLHVEVEHFVERQPVQYHECPGEDIYVTATDAERYTPDGPVLYDGPYQWSVNGVDRETNTSGDLCIVPPDGVQKTVSVQIGNDEHSASDTLSLGGEPGELDLQLAVVDESSTPSRYRTCPGGDSVMVSATGYIYTGEGAETYTGSVTWTVAGNVETTDVHHYCVSQDGRSDREVTAEIAHEGQTASATITIGADEEAGSGEVVAKIERQLDAQELESGLGSSVNTDDGATIAATGTGMAYPGGAQYVPPNEEVTFTAERSWVMGNGEVSGYEWYLLRALNPKGPSVGNTEVVDHQTGPEFTYEFLPPNTDVSVSDEYRTYQTRNADFTTAGSYLLFLRVRTTRGNGDVVTGILSHDPGQDGVENASVQAPPHVGTYDLVTVADSPNADVVLRPDDGRLVDRAGAAVDASVWATYRLHDDAHAGRSTLAVPLDEV
ncbi:hypothetical protein [Haloarchaeobius iranensis]|uniref:PKD domain-containing protein n=1 Tax=Haloarchaeobius iranensis TaxID=996166 RepID=A0A1G9X1T5_9EURY|nr:hypothetical protein [Haloarchaeobius iranensis]SDM90689.1 hypothetical protein SAMN05192554_109107 [Haloarchaeobius iranensis]